MRLKGLPERAYNILFHTHTVAGIAISFGLFIIFYAGAFSIFRDEIYRWENPNARIEVVEAIDLDRVIATVKANNENFVEQSQFTIRTPDEYSPFVRFFGSEYRDETKERTKRFSALLNPNEDYEYRHLAKPETTLGNTLYRLHYFGQIPLGIYISGFVALFFLFASITGIVIHWRNLVTKFYAFTVRGKWRQIWTNAHTVLGVIGLPFQIMYAVTGALFGLLILLLIPSAFILFGGDTNKLMATVRPNAAIEVDKNAPIAEHAPLAKYFEKTKEDYPDYNVGVAFARNYGREDGVITFRLDDKKTINGLGEVTYALTSGEVLVLVDPERKSYTDSVLNAVSKLHFASYGGLGLKIIYFILAMITCFMILSGVLLWKEARNNKRYTERQKRFHHKVTKVYLAICLGLFPATAIIFIANKLVPMEIITRATYVNAAFFLSWLALVIAGLFWNNLKKLNRNYLVIGGVLSLLVPICNGIVTGDWLWNTLLADPWVASVDIFWLMTGISSFLIIYFMPSTEEEEVGVKVERRKLIIKDWKVEEPIVASTSKNGKISI